MQEKKKKLPQKTVVGIFTPKMAAVLPKRHLVAVTKKASEFHLWFFYLTILFSWAEVSGPAGGARALQHLHE